MGLHKVADNLFSFYVSDMSSALRELNTKDFMDPINLVQLADDTTLFADNIKSLQVKFKSLFQFLSKKYQVPNNKKTKYLSFFRSIYL